MTPPLPCSRTRLLAALFAGLLCVAAGDAARAQTLTVTNGALGPALTPGATNHLWADPPGTNAVFDRWTGDTNLLADPYAWHTTAIMPTTNAVVTATFKAAPPWTPTTHILNGLAANDPDAVRLIYFFPPNPVGVIFRFHGTGGLASSFFNKVEDFAFARDAVAAGYAVAALDSADRTNRMWAASATAANVDVVSVQAAIDYFISLGLMTTNTPKFAVGMSNGGGFAPKPAHFLGFNACAIWCASGAPMALFNVTTVPTIWNLALYDDLYDHTDFLPNATTNLGRLAARGIAGELRENPPAPVHPRRFLRVPGLSAPNGQTIYNSLKTAGLLDAQDFLVSDPGTNGWFATLPPGFGPYQTEIQDQLDCCYSAHKFFSDYNHHTLRFFGARRPPVEGRGGISDVSPLPVGGVRLTVMADAGQTYRLQHSTNLALPGVWSAVATNTNSAGTFDWFDSSAALATNRFYRTLSP
jgi:hypothetical protein